MSKAFYITTPIYYVNDVPHIGHSYTTIVADILTRYHRLFGDEAYFLTGVDEHGQKAQNAARAAGKDTQEYVDQMCVRYTDIWKELNISYDFFIRTTMESHKKCVQLCLQKLFDKGDIYLHEYEGWYSVSEEIFYTEKDLVNGKSPAGKEVQKVTEKNYFFRMSDYQERLTDYVNKNPSFIQPDGKRSEVQGFLKMPTNDLCISRPKNRLNWGIEMPFDKDYVTYVWFDALINYISALGYGTSDTALYNKFWSEAIHLIGKDILTPHAIYWPTMLMALDIPLPKQIFAHGWWLNDDGGKMSKSEGPVVAPLDMKDLVGVDAFRYFLTRDIYLGNDAKFSKDLVLSRVNSELANNFGNMVSRTINLIDKYFGARIPEAAATHELTKDLIKLAGETPALVREKIEAMAPNLAVGHIVDLLNATNKYLDTMAPWKTAKEDLQNAAETLYTSVEIIRIAAILLAPVMPSKTGKLMEQLGLPASAGFADAQKWGVLKAGHRVTKSEPLFPRIS